MAESVSIIGAISALGGIIGTAVQAAKSLIGLIEQREDSDVILLEAMHVADDVKRRAQGAPSVARKPGAGQGHRRSLNVRIEAGSGVAGPTRTRNDAFSKRFAGKRQWRFASP
ncbi:hypothetical protein BKA67DRAFT_542360 [Truncatella angustata]|uniref:Uncharacterized protein n=1 Tax=Truncatella angustata TaxID=152316 RepID=A0A9P8RFD1_9PEZI|nr:uncharacterized protein BKA67DRAFT_542360 [Truncatella angustata]KAH6643403.1 hypothetical protein BKA67DRAFT_542360 [Truncatella angustata]KAH8201822.1 hypothetical protein TruAng_003996 [Truncatella angustata]